MGWLGDRVLQHVYRSEKGEEIILELKASEDRPDSYTNKGTRYAFAETVPYRSLLTFKIQFERNGLVAYKYDQGDGKPRIVSATRENYEKNIGNMPEHKVRQMKSEGRLSELSKSITTKGYQKTYERVKEKRGVK